VKNPSHVSCGVREVFLDGARVAKNDGVRHALLPVYPAGSVHDVVIVLGRI
jgi:hypothetical protein